MYPYFLACYLKTHKLCRAYIYDILPSGFVKIISYREPYSRYRYFPHDYMTGELKSEYWSLPRVCDILREEAIERTTTMVKESERDI